MDVEIVEYSGWHFLHSYITKQQGCFGLFLVPWQEELPETRPIPLDVQKVVSSPLKPIRQPRLVLQQMVSNHIRRWTDFFTTQAVASIQRMVAELQRDEHFAAIAATSHRPRRQAQKPQHRVVLSIEDY